MLMTIYVAAIFIVVSVALITMVVTHATDVLSVPDKVMITASAAYIAAASVTATLAALVHAVVTLHYARRRPLNWYIAASVVLGTVTLALVVVFSFIHDPSHFIDRGALSMPTVIAATASIVIGAAATLGGLDWAVAREDGTSKPAL